MLMRHIASSWRAISSPSTSRSRAGGSLPRSIAGWLRYIRAFILKRELKQYIAAHEAAGVHLDTQCQEVCYDSGIYLLLRRTQGTWYITDIVLMDAAAGFVPVFTWERVRRGVSGALRRVLLCWQNPAARPSGGEAVCL